MQPVEEITIPPEKREEILNELRQVLAKWNTIKIKIVRQLNCINCIKRLN